MTVPEVKLLNLTNGYLGLSRSGERIYFTLERGVSVTFSLGREEARELRKSLGELYPEIAQ